MSWSVAAISALSGGVGGSGLTAWVQRKKLSADTVHVEAETVEVESQAAAKITEAALGMMEVMRADLREVKGELAEMRKVILQLEKDVAECEQHRTVDQRRIETLEAEVKRYKLGDT